MSSRMSVFDLGSIENEIFAKKPVEKKQEQAMIRKENEEVGYFQIEEDCYIKRQSQFAKSFISQIQFQEYEKSEDSPLDLGSSDRRDGFDKKWSDESGSDFLEPCDLRDRIEQPISQTNDKDMINQLAEQNAALRQYLERFDIISRVLEMENFEYSPEVWDTVVSLCKSCA